MRAMKQSQSLLFLAFSLLFYFGYFVCIADYFSMYFYYMHYYFYKGLTVPTLLSADVYGKSYGVNITLKLVLKLWCIWSVKANCNSRDCCDRQPCASWSSQFSGKHKPTGPGDIGESHEEGGTVSDPSTEFPHQPWSAIIQSTASHVASRSKEPAPAVAQLETQDCLQLSSRQTEHDNTCHVRLGRLR